MDANRRSELEARGYMVVDDAADWLGLDEVERKMVELRVRLGREVRRLREAKDLSQAELATRIKSSQSRVAKVEGNSDGVGLDLLMRAFFGAGGTLADLAEVVGRTG
jgi:predicted XRE-type DNA-binding protein